MNENKIILKESKEKSSVRKKKNFLVVSSDWIGEFDPIKLIQKARKKREITISK